MSVPWMFSFDPATLNASPFAILKLFCDKNGVGPKRTS